MVYMLIKGNDMVYLVDQTDEEEEDYNSTLGAWGSGIYRVDVRAY